MSISYCLVCLYSSYFDCKFQSKEPIQEVSSDILSLIVLTKELCFLISLFMFPLSVSMPFLSKALALAPKWMVGISSIPCLSKERWSTLFSRLFFSKYWLQKVAKLSKKTFLNLEFQKQKHLLEMKFSFIILSVLFVIWFVVVHKLKFKFFRMQWSSISGYAFLI